MVANYLFRSGFSGAQPLYVTATRCITGVRCLSPVSTDHVSETDMPHAAIVPAPHQPVEVREFPTPEIEPGGALLDTVYSEVCGTDVYLQQGLLEGVPYPLIPGHVSVGRVSELNGTVVDVDGQPIRVGETVTFLDVHETCNHCWYCLVAKATTRCPKRKVYGITYGADDGLLGGWSEQIYLKPGVKIIKLPARLDPRRLIAAGCALPTALHAVDRAEIRIGDQRGGPGQRTGGDQRGHPRAAFGSWSGDRGGSSRAPIGGRRPAGRG